jgi:hypothetical protein
MIECFDVTGNSDDANGEENRKMCCCTKVTDLFDKKEEFTI